ncbi:AAA family ATPase [Actinomycetospora lutea]|uniref:helix-turn-helix transcriptional regulator n=1 Tax=Actinomycetospora lutea TaxID=663604 RepID=UPI002365025B|nr:LuxR family transcriptional regulator [Actinomycetospora lutea]MDD7939972.1 AAA family ATPase [Actinomycetospora lutea]
MTAVLEREDELAAAGELVDGVLRGEGGLLLVEGDAGIGKTTLVRAARDLARGRDLPVAGARGAELERDLAFGVARELLAPVVGPAGSGAAAAVLSPSAPPAAGVDLFAVLHALYWAVVDRAAQGPLVLTVDDVHWCDLPSLRFLAYLARRLEGLPVALLVAGRPVTLDPARTEVLDAVAREPGVRVLRPAPLSPAGTRTLITDVLGTPESGFEDACRRATGGNPFLLGELLADLRRTGTTPRDTEVDRVAAAVPREVERSVRTRLATLGPEAASLARAAAVLGDGVHPRRAAELAGLSPVHAGTVGDALVTARVLAPRRGSTDLTFLHPLVRSAVEAGVGPSEWAEAHRRAVEVLVAAGVDGDGLVRHLLAARPTGDPVVVDALRAAARRAAARGVPESAVTLLRRALDEPPAPDVRPAILLELGTAEMRAGDPAALAHLVTAADEAGDVDARAIATLPLARALLHAGQSVEAVRRMVAVLEELEAGDPRGEGERALELEAELLTVATQNPATRPVVEARLARRSRDPEPTTRGGCVLLAALAVEEVIVEGSRARALALAESALSTGILLQEPVMARLPAVGITLTFAGRPAQAVAMWDEALERLRGLGDVRNTALATAFRGQAATFTGDLAAALADTRLAVELTEGDPSQALTRGFAVAWLADVLSDHDEADAAEDLLTAHAPLFAMPSAGSYLMLARGRLRLAQGRFEEAEQDLRESGRRVGATGSRGGAVFRWRPPLALALAGQGETREARDVAEQALAAAERWGAPLPWAEALSVAGRVAPGADGLPRLRRAVEVAEPVPVERARALLALGEALRRRDGGAGAREVLREALDVALERSVRSVARRAHDELVAAGARPRRLRSSGADALTPTERRVATAAAGGATNRAVAQALFVSEKTVETHLGSVYRKLGITARSQLGDALRGAPEIRPPSPAAGTRR